MFGPHLMLDLYECRKERLTDVTFVEGFLDTLPEKIGMTKISKPFVVFYPGKVESFDKGGVTGFVFLAESHISVHTFAREYFASVDIFSCKEFDVKTTEKLVMDAFEAKRAERNFIARGMNFVKVYPVARGGRRENRGRYSETTK